MRITKKKIVLCGVDHVVADSGWRDAMIGGEGGWDAYHVAGGDDGCVDVMIDLVDALRKYDFEVHGLTARPEKWRGLTMSWLVDHGVMFESLIMRPENNFDPSPILKMKMAKEIWSPLRDSIAFLIEDHDDVCALFRAEGVVCLQCHLYASCAPSIPFAIENAEGKL